MTLSILWFVLIAVLWTGYLVLEGFDFGVGMLLRIITRGDRERTSVVRTIGPHWDGNEVWLLTAGGATFAAFPEWYATMFSGMYLPLFLILVLLILRISAIEWRSKLASAQWRSVWDWFHTVAAFGVPLLLGVAFGNLAQGMKIEVVDRATQQAVPVADLQGAAATSSHQLTGGFVSLLTPFTLLTGVALVAVCLSAGAQFLALKTDGPVRERANRLAAPASLAAVVLVGGVALWGQFAHASNVYAWIPLVIAALALIASCALSQQATRREGWSLAGSAVGTAGLVAWVFCAMAPAVMKSSIDPAYSLTIDQASATQPTLQIMSVVALVLVPVILAYTAWSYWTFRHRVSPDDVDRNPGLPLRRIRVDHNFLAG